MRESFREFLPFRRESSQPNEDSTEAESMVLSESEIVSRVMTDRDRPDFRGAAVYPDQLPEDIERPEVLYRWIGKDLPVGLQGWKRGSQGWEPRISIRDVNAISSEEVLSLLAKVPKIYDWCLEAVQKRNTERNNPVCPLGVALFQFAKGEDEPIYKWNADRWDVYITDNIIGHPEREAQFRYILENYVRTQTDTERYKPVADYLSHAGVGTKKGQSACFLDIGSSVGTSLAPLFDLPRLDIYAIDKIPPELNPLINSEKQLSMYVEGSNDTIVDKIDPSLIPKVAKRVRFVQGDALSLPVKSESVTVVNYSHILRHLSPEVCEKMIAEGKRVLMEGGLMIIQPTVQDKDNKKTTILILKKVRGEMIEKATI